MLTSLHYSWSAHARMPPLPLLLLAAAARGAADEEGAGSDVFPDSPGRAGEMFGV